MDDSFTYNLEGKKAVYFSKNIIAPVLKVEIIKDFDEKDILFSVTCDTLDNWNKIVIIVILI